MDLTDCEHDIVIDGICQECNERLDYYFKSETCESTRKKASKRNNENLTNNYIKGILNMMVGSIDQEILDRVAAEAENNIVQIRNFITAKIVVFAYIYSELYSRNLEPEELFKLTPDRLAAIMELKKKDVTKALTLINNSKIRGPGFIMTHPYLYLLEFRRNKPKAYITELITDDLIEHIKTSIDPEVSSIAHTNPAKTAISYMSLLSEKIQKPERGSIKPVQEMYDFYALVLSQVKDTLPNVREFFRNEFPRPMKRTTKS